MDNQEPTKIDTVQVEGLVALKIIKHCVEEGASEGVQGVLLGLLNDKTLEITNCFPHPKIAEDEMADYDEAVYQMEMMRKLRDVNVDHFQVGWYQSVFLGAFINRNLLESQFNYQDSISESVVLTYDPLQSQQGILSLKAYRLTEKLMELYRSGEKVFTTEGLAEQEMSYSNLFEEVPVVIKNSNLINALVCEIESKLPRHDNQQFLSLATGSYLEKSVHLLIEGVDELGQDSQKLHNYQRNYARQQQMIDQWRQKRQAENDLRRTRGEPPLPDEDVNKQFRPLQLPPRLDNLLTTAQLGTYCEQMHSFASQNFAKLFVAEAVQKPCEKE